MRMPAEWEPHAATWMGWPMHEWWEEDLELARLEIARLASIMSDYGTVKLLVPPQQAALAQRMTAGRVEVVDMPLSDCWLRDSGPTFVRRPDGGLSAVCWHFNGWGGKWELLEDAGLSGRIAGLLDIPIIAAPLVFEGGNVCSDGDGTVLVSETAVLNENRNPGVSRERVESIFRTVLGAQKVIWLPGDIPGDHTDGHVDGIAMFARPGLVIAASDPHGEARDRLEANREVLLTATDARGRRLDVLTLPNASPPDSDGDFSTSYINAYLANGTVVMPAFGNENEDALARLVMRTAFPHYGVVQVRHDTIASGGGHVHCCCQQEPL